MVYNFASSISLPVKNPAYSRAPDILNCANNSTDNKNNLERKKERKKGKRRIKKETPRKLFSPMM